MPTINQRLKDLLAQTAAPQSTTNNAINGKVNVENLHEDVLELIQNNQTITLQMPPDITVDIAETAQIPAFMKVVDDLKMGNNVFLVGEAGTGKTTLAEKVAAALGREFIAVPCNQWTAPGEFMGQQTIDGYQEGKLIDCWVNGKMLILDELPKLDPNTAGVLNDALAKSATPNAVLTNNRNETFPKHPNFIVIATGNTTGKGTNLKYGGNNRQDASLLDRFSTSFYFIEFNMELEKSLTFSVVFDIFHRMREVLIVMESEEIITLRTMLNANRIYHLEMQRKLGKIPPVEGGKTLVDSIESFLATMDEDEREQVRDRAKIDDFLKKYDAKERYLEDLKRSGFSVVETEN